METAPNPILRAPAKLGRTGVRSYTAESHTHGWCVFDIGAVAPDWAGPPGRPWARQCPEGPPGGPLPFSGARPHVDERHLAAVRRMGKHGVFGRTHPGLRPPLSRGEHPLLGPNGDCPNSTAVARRSRPTPGKVQTSCDVGINRHAPPWTLRELGLRRDFATSREISERAFESHTGNETAERNFSCAVRFQRGRRHPSSPGGRRRCAEIDSLHAAANLGITLPAL